MKAMKLRTDFYQVVIFQLKMFRSRSLTTAAVSRKRSFEEFSVEKEEKIEIATKQKKSRSEAFSDFFLVQRCFSLVLSYFLIGLSIGDSDSV